MDPSSTTEFSDLLFFADFEGECPDGYDFAKVGDIVECLRIRDDDAAGILEPERVGAIKGATMDIFFYQMATPAASCMTGIHLSVKLRDMTVCSM